MGSIDMIKYGHEFNPLNEPSRQDCLFRLGCCYEDNDEVMQQYPFMPRCYHRVKNEVIDSRLHDYKLVYSEAEWYKESKVANYDANRVCSAAKIHKFLEDKIQAEFKITRTDIYTYYNTRT